MISQAVGRVGRIPWLTAPSRFQNRLDELLVKMNFDQVRVAFILCWNFEASDADRPGAVVLLQAV